MPAIVLRTEGEQDFFRRPLRQVADRFDGPGPDEAAASGRVRCIPQLLHGEIAAPAASRERAVHGFRHRPHSLFDRRCRVEVVEQIDVETFCAQHLEHPARILLRLPEDRLLAGGLSSFAASARIIGSPYGRWPGSACCGAVSVKSGSSRRRKARKKTSRARLSSPSSRSQVVHHKTVRVDAGGSLHNRACARRAERPPAHSVPPVGQQGVLLPVDSIAQPERRDTVAQQVAASAVKGFGGHRSYAG